MTEPEPQLSFTAFVLSLASTAAIHFGDLPDPMSGERAEVNLDGAAQMIEILGLLEQKTRGNLTNEEREILGQVLYELRMRFVEATGGGKRIIDRVADALRQYSDRLLIAANDPSASGWLAGVSAFSDVRGGGAGGGPETRNSRRVCGERSGSSDGSSSVASSCKVPGDSDVGWSGNG